jgi:hypothetical protein
MNRGTVLSSVKFCSSKPPTDGHRQSLSRVSYQIAANQLFEHALANFFTLSKYAALT